LIIRRLQTPSVTMSSLETVFIHAAAPFELPQTGAGRFMSIPSLPLQRVRN